MDDADSSRSSLIDDAELEELDTYLRTHAGEEGLLLDGVHGLLTAVGIGPQLIPPDEWFPEVINSPFTNESEGKRILSLLERLNDSVGVEIIHKDYEPILGQLDSAQGNTVLTAQGWCEGFSRGIDLRAQEWEARLNTDSQLIELLGPIMALSVEEEIFITDENFQALSDQEYEECLMQIPQAVIAIAHYWENQPLSGEEVDELKNIENNLLLPSTSRRRNGRWLH